MKADDIHDGLAADYAVTASRIDAARPADTDPWGRAFDQILAAGGRVGWRGYDPTTPCGAPSCGP